jgi:hypothetical protein
MGGWRRVVAQGLMTLLTEELLSFQQMPLSLARISHRRNFQNQFADHISGRSPSVIGVRHNDRRIPQSLPLPRRIASIESS